MPELPEVESVRRQLDPEMSGRTIEDVWSDPHPNVPRQFIEPERAIGHRIDHVGRRGKFLVAPLEGDLELVMHLGMTGSFSFTEKGTRQGPLRMSAGTRKGTGRVPDAYARAILALDDGRELVFRDPRRFGRIAVVEAGDYHDIPTLAAIGPEPLSDEFDRDVFASKLARTTAPVKPYLLSQRPVAGVGNIYADEALWLARIHPLSRRVGRARAHALHAAIRDVLEGAIEREGTTFSDYRMVNGESGRNASFLIAYGQVGRPCPRCATPLKKIVLGGRGTTYCPKCQRA